MTLKELIKDLQDLDNQGHGSLTVLGCDSGNGSYGEISSAHVSDEQDDMGPFDVEPGAFYVSLSVGH